MKDMKNLQTWPPEYQLRRSARAKYLRIEICPEKGLLVILPTQVSEQHILPFLNRKRRWIVSHLNKYTPSSRSLPSSLNIACIGEILTITRTPVDMPNTYVAYCHQSMNINIYGQVSDDSACLTALRRWLKVFAEKLLRPWLNRVSEDINIPYNKLAIGDQKTCWGSCNHQKNISLNLKLIFLPKDLLRYILIHELCHCIHLNHSQEFWNLIASHDPNYQQHKVALKKYTLPTLF